MKIEVLSVAVQDIEAGQQFYEQLQDGWGTYFQDALFQIVLECSPLGLRCSAAHPRNVCWILPPPTARSKMSLLKSSTARD